MLKNLNYTKWGAQNIFCSRPTSVEQQSFSYSQSECAQHVPYNRMNDCDNLLNIPVSFLSYGIYWQGLHYLRHCPECLTLGLLASNLQHSSSQGIICLYTYSEGRPPRFPLGLLTRVMLSGTSDLCVGRLRIILAYRPPPPSRRITLQNQYGRE